MSSEELNPKPCKCCFGREIHRSTCKCLTVDQGQAYRDRFGIDTLGIPDLTEILNPAALHAPFPPLQNDCIVRAARGLRTEKVPVWFMRQAGLYLPEYRELNKKHSFSEMIHTPSLACEVTMLPVLCFDIDAAIIFSDILVVPEALGMGVVMRPDHFGREERNWSLMTKTLCSPCAINELSLFNFSKKLEYVYEAMRLARYELKGRVPLIGFAGAPWTLMCYMIEGEDSKTMSKAKSWLYKWPEESHKLLRLLMRAVVLHLVNQIHAGAQLLLLYEPNAEYLTPYLFTEFSWPYIKEIKKLVTAETRNRLHEPMVPMILYVKGSALVIDLMKPFNYDCLSVDFTVIPSEVRRYMPRKIALQGNVDPPALTANRRRIKNLVKKMLKGFGVLGYIANVGHGMCPDVPPENVAYFVAMMHSLSGKIMAKKIAKEWDPDYYADRKLPRYLFRERTPDWYPFMDPSEMLLDKYYR